MAGPNCPARRPRYVAPWACAASSTIASPWRSAIATSGSMSAIRPYRWTGMIAFVRGVIAASTAVGVDAEVVRPDVHEDRAWRRPRRIDADRRVEAEADGDHLVAGADPERRAGPPPGRPSRWPSGRRAARRSRRPRPPRTRPSGGPWRACRSGGPRGRPAPRPARCPASRSGSRGSLRGAGDAAVALDVVAGGAGRAGGRAGRSRRATGPSGPVDQALPAGADPADAAGPGCRRRARGRARRG